MENVKSKKYWFDFALKYLIAPIGVAIIVSFISFVKISKLEEKIQVQNSVIQSSKTKIENLEQNIISLNNTIQIQNSVIQNSETKIESLEQDITTLNTQITKIIGNVFNAPVTARDIIGKKEVNNH